MNNTERQKWGSIREVVLQARINNMPAKVAARHFKVSANSIYWCARRMKVSLPPQKRGPRPKTSL